MKHVHRLFVALFLLQSISVANAQQSCGTEPADQASTFDFVQAHRPFSPHVAQLVTTEVPVQFHIIGSSTGALAIDSATVFAELALVNEAFAQIDIEFVHCGLINYINDNSYLTFTKGTDEVLCDIHDVPYAINVYFALNVENSAGESLCGYAYNMDFRNRMFMDNSCASNSSTFTHEFGHVFSLVHTHATSNGEELANGTNCSTAGDLLCDTPADPRLNDTIVDEDCEYVGSEIDLEGNAYDPDTGNLMSYSRKECRMYFSAQQYEQMEAFFLLEGGYLECNSGTVNTADLGPNATAHLYPNPSGGSLFIEGITDASTIYIRDIHGRLYWQSAVSASQDRLAVTEFASLSAGLYIISIQSKTGDIQSLRAIKL